MPDVHSHHAEHPTELIKNRIAVIPTKSPCPVPDISTENSIMSPTEKAKNIGVTLDDDLLFAPEIVTMVKYVIQSTYMALTAVKTPIAPGTRSSLQVGCAPFQHLL